MRCSTWNIRRSCLPDKKADVPRGTSIRDVAGTKTAMFHVEIWQLPQPYKKSPMFPRGTF
jgi:hypothetical protein